MWLIAKRTHHLVTSTTFCILENELTWDLTRISKAGRCNLNLLMNLLSFNSVVLGRCELITAGQAWVSIVFSTSPHYRPKARCRDGTRRRICVIGVVRPYDTLVRTRLSHAPATSMRSDCWPTVWSLWRQDPCLVQL